MSQKIVLNAEARTDLGKGASRRLRREGKIPAIAYGGKTAPVAVTLEQREVQKEIKKESFYSQILTVVLGGKEQQFILKDLHRHPFKPIIMHMDLERVSADKHMTVHVPVHFVNESSAVGVSKQGGIVSHHLIDIEISCLPADLPEHIEVDLAKLEAEHTIHLSELTLPKGVTIVALAHNDDKAVVSINLPRAGKAEDEDTIVAASNDSAENEKNSDNKAADKSKDKKN